MGKDTVVSPLWSTISAPGTRARARPHSAPRAPAPRAPRPRARPAPAPARIGGIPAG